MNTDQDSEFTAAAFVDAPHRDAVRVGMDGNGCWRDDVFAERLWMSFKYEHVYLRACETTSEARTKLAVYLDFHHRRRPHSSLGRQAPMTCASTGRR
jgi:putative transposase